MEEIRSLETCGLLRRDDTQASLDPLENFRVITAWPELVEALDTPGCAVVRGAAPVRLGVRQAVADTAGPESLAPAEKTSSLKLGAAVYDDANAADKTQARDIVVMLRDNVAAEAEKPLKFPPWYKSPWLRNLCRFIPLAAIGVGMIYYGGKNLEGNAMPMKEVGMIALGGLIFSGGAYFVFFLTPARWGND